MTWAPLLLADPSPCLRWRVLSELLARPPDDPEVGELKDLRATDPLVVDLLALQQPDGSWKNVDLSGIADCIQPAGHFSGVDAPGIPGL